MTAPAISVVIVNYNVKDLLLTCLESLYRFAPPEVPIETIVVDNGSIDGSAAALARLYPQVAVIANGFNAGFPAANNQAFRAAQGRYIFMLNPDTEFYEDTLGKLFAEMERDRSVSLIAPKLLNADRSRQLSVWRFPTAWTVFCETNYLRWFLARRNYGDRNLETAFDAETCSGAAIFFRREVIREIGALDERMFWIEDVDFCRRAHDAGLRLLYYPAAGLVHHIGQSAKKNYLVAISNQVFAKVKFFRKHHPGLPSFLVTCISVYHVTLKALALGLLSPFDEVYRRKAAAYLYTWPRIIRPPIGMS